MNKQNILQQIEEALPSMTKSQLKIANNILQNPTMLLFSSIEQAAELLGVSTATIVRFANLFGFHGYTELQNSVRSYYQECTEPELRLNANLSITDGKQNLYFSTYAKQMHMLELLYNKDFEAKLEKATYYLNNASHIYTAAPRASYSVAYYIGHHLNRIFKNCDILESNERLADALVRITSNDVVLIVNHPRYTKTMVGAANIAKSASAKLIVISDSFLSPYSKIADVFFAVSNQSGDFHNSLLPSMMIAEILITAMMITNKEKTQESIRNLNPVLKQLDIFI